MKLIRVLIALLLLGSAADAATLISTATGNIGATGTWSVVDTTGTNAFLNAEAPVNTGTALTTSPVASSTFTPASETVTAIGVKLASVAAAPSGTMTVKLANSTAPGTRECTQTVNVADLTAVNGAPTAATSDGGWVILTCAAVPNGTDAYTITANTSVGAMVNLFSLATTNWSRLIVTNGTKVNGPAAGDKFYVFGQLTGAGTHNAFTVTINTTSLVNYGNVANTLVDPSVAVGQWGTLAFAATASTAFVSELAGPMVVYNGGTFTVGTAGTPIPSTSSATLTLNSTVEGDTGINVRNGGTFNSAGSSGGRAVTKTLLTTTANAAATSLTVADSTGWLSGDSIVLAPTQTGGTLYDAVALSGNATGTTLPVAALTNQHTATQLSYTSGSTGIAYSMNMYAAVILLNRNVVIQGSSTTTNGYLYFQANAIGAIDWTEFAKVSGTVAAQRGLEVDVGPLGSFSLTNSSFHDSHNSSIVLAPANTNFGGTSGAYLTIQHNGIYNCATAGSGTAYGFGFLNATYNPFVKIDDLTVIRAAYNTATTTPVLMTGFAPQFTNITISGSGSNVLTGVLILSGSYTSLAVFGGAVGNPWGPITTYANAGGILSTLGSSEGFTGTISGWYSWHEQGRMLPSVGGGEWTIDPFYIIQSGFGLYLPSGGGTTLTLRNGVIGFDTNGSQNYPLTIDAVQANITFDNMELCPFGLLGGVTFVACSQPNVISIMHDVNSGSGTNPTQSVVFLRNSSILNQGANYPSFRGEESFYGTRAAVVQDCAACSPVKHAAWLAGGFLSYDSVIARASGYSLRMTPKLTTFSGYIIGNTLTTTAALSTEGDQLTSNGAGFINGTYILGGAGTSFTVSQSQTVCSVGSPCQFQSYNNAKGLLRLQSAPFGRGVKVAVASGKVASPCVWVRPSISSDAGPTWGGSGVTYNGDQPRLINRANPAMGVQSDTVLATAAATAGAWSQLCGTLPAAPSDGEFELVVDADQTFTSNAGGWVNVTDWSATVQ